MKQEPSYGAIPSATDLKKQREGQEEEKVWREDYVYSLLQPEALKRLNKTEQDNSAKADEIKARLFDMANRGTKGNKDTPFSDAAKEVKKGSITDDDMKRLIEGAGQGAANSMISDSRGVVLDRRRRFDDDSDSDVDLDGL